jgi:hypothetical protein
MCKYAPLVEKGDPSSNDLVSCASDSLSSCKSLERDKLL